MTSFKDEVRKHLNLDHPDCPEIFRRERVNISYSDTMLTRKQADEQQEAIKKIMADRKVPFEQAVDIFIKQRVKK